MTDARTYQKPTDFSDELSAAFLAFGLALSDTKHQLGMQNSHWVTGTPALEAAVGAAAMTQDELGHARSLYALLATFPRAPQNIKAENDLQARPERNYPAILGPRWDSWLEMIAVNVTLDRALHIIIASMIDSAYSRWAGFAAKINQEEAYHRVFGDTWVKRIATGNPEVAAQLQQEIIRYAAVSDRWFGPPEDVAAALLTSAGILPKPFHELRQVWQHEVRDLMASCGWSLSDRPETDWSQWDAARREA